MTEQGAGWHCSINFFLGVTHYEILMIFVHLLTITVADASTLWISESTVEISGDCSCSLADD